MVEEVRQLLQQCLSPDAVTRMQSEARLSQLATLPGFPDTLVAIALEPTNALGDRQSAGVHLKNYIYKNWNSSSENFVGTEPSVEGHALGGLADAEHKIRVLMAAIVQTIASLDGPESWPELLPALMSCLQSRNPHQTDGAMSVLNDLVMEISEEEFSLIAPALLPEVHRIFLSEADYTYDIRARAVRIFRTFANTIKTVEEIHTNVKKLYLDPILPLWLQAFKGVVSHVDISPQALCIRAEIFSCVDLLLAMFKDRMIPHMTDIVPLAWNYIDLLQNPYLTAYVNPLNGADPIEEADLDGEARGMQPLLFAVFSIMGRASMSNKLAAIFSLNNVPTDLLKQIDEWREDPNIFILEEEEVNVTSAIKVREAISELLSNQLLKRHMLPTLTSLIEASHYHLSTSSASRAQGNANWWKVHESCLYHIAENHEILARQVEAGKISFDLGGLLDHVIFEDLKCSDQPILQGRALWFASTFTDALPANYNEQFISAAVSALAASNAIPFRICAIQAVSRFCGKDNGKALLAPYFPAIVENIGQMLAGAQDNGLNLLVDTLSLVLNLNHPALARYEPILTTALMTVLSNPDGCDYFISESILECFKTFTKNPEVRPSFQQAALPIIIRTVSDYSLLDENPTWYASAINTCDILIRYNSAPLPPVFVSEIFPALMKAMLSTNNRTIIQDSEQCLRRFIEKDLGSIAQWRSVDGKTGMDIILHVIAHLLNPYDADMGTISIGSVITAFIKHAGQALLPVLPDLLAAVVRRLNIPKTIPSVVESLVLVFAQLLNEHLQTTISFLAEMRVDGETGLNIVLRRWSECSFSGRRSVRANLRALAALMEQNDERVAAVTVQGYPQETKKQYVMVPFPAKVMMLLVAEYQNALEVKAANDMKGHKAFGDEYTVESDADFEVNSDDDDGDALDDFDGLDDIDDINELANEDDEDIANDEADLINVDPATFAAQFLKHWNASYPRFNDLAQCLPEGDKKVLAKLLAH
ncbi:Importin 9 [Irineochytrium annulatum]|nr:Importin 9 [Irineochytrium annulatum]